MEPNGFAAQGYLSAKVILTALQAIGGNAEDKPAFLKALRNVKFDDSVRGPWRFDEYQNATSNMYVLKAVRTPQGKVRNSIIYVLKDIEQYWPKGKPSK